MCINIERIENNVRQLRPTPHEDFILRFLRAYEVSEATLARLGEGGDRNKAKRAGELLWRKKLLFKPETARELLDVIDELKNEEKIKKYQPRFIVVSDFVSLLALDTHTDDTLDTSIVDLGRHVDFFLPLRGIEREQIQNENIADIRAAEKLGELYDRIVVDNPDDFDSHALNVFLTRLLFCFFAEDTGIFDDPSGRRSR